MGALAKRGRAEAGWKWEELREDEREGGKGKR